MACSANKLGSIVATSRETCNEGKVNASDETAAVTTDHDATGSSRLRGGRGGTGLGRRQSSDCFPAPLDLRGTMAIGEEAVVADAMKAVWQDVQEVAVYERVGGEPHNPT
jgi:hypothetical protein